MKVSRALTWVLATGALVGGASYAAPIYDPVNNLTYVKDPAVLTWNAANAAAQAAGGELARVRDLAANEAIRLVTNGSGGWIGATDQGSEGDWRWTAGNAQFWSGLAANSATPGSPVGGLFTRWNAGEPNDVGGEDFGQMTTSGFWNDLPATSTLPSVRELVGNQAIQSFEGHLYTLIVGDTWNNAQARAMAMGGNLVRIDSAAENSFVASLLAGTGGGSAWIGGSDQSSEGDWRWVDGNVPFWSGLAANNAIPGAPVGGLYVNWNGGEPNDAGGEDFAEIQASGGWNDLPAGVSRIAVVEVVPEPASIALLGLAATGLLARRRRRA